MVETQQLQQQQEEINKNRDETFGYFSKLADKDILELIFSDFTVEELIKYQSISQGFYVLFNDDRLWKDRFLFQIKGRQEPLVYRDQSWKSTAIHYLFPEKLKSKPFPFSILHFPKFASMEIYTRWLRRHMIVKEYGTDTGQVEHIDCDTLTVQEFIDRYEKPLVPVIIKGITKDWKAKDNWVKEKLVERIGEKTFKITHQSHKRIPMKFKDYANYMSTQCDEEPLYVFDESFGEKEPELLKDYNVPKYFPEDLFEVSGKERPHFRWVVIGPPRSGAPWHIDPAGTSAWNTLLSGKKRWLLYPPQFQPIGVHLEDISEKFYGSLPSLLWLLEVYPYLPPDNKPIECIQQPGEAIFVPGGWWHMVLNMEESIAVTQNYCDTQNFKQVCEELCQTKNEYQQFRHYLLKSKPEYQNLIDDFELMESQMRHSFDNLKIWEPMIKNLYQKYIISSKIEGSNESADQIIITHPISGQSPVFIIDKKFVIKFYSTEFGGEKAFSHETHLYSILPDSLKPKYPKLIASGFYKDYLQEFGHTQEGPKIGVNCECKKVVEKKDDNTCSSNTNNVVDNSKCKDDHEDTNECSNCKDKMDFKWKWPFIITTFVEGVNLQEVQIVPQAMDYPYPPQEIDEEEEDDEEVPDVDYEILVSQVLKNLWEIHNVPIQLESNNPFLPDKSDLWAYWRSHLDHLKTKYRQNIYNWAGFPSHLASKVDSYLPNNLHDLIDYNLPPVYLHADLTDENVLGTIHKEPIKKPIKKQSSQKAQTTQSKMKALMDKLSNQRIVKHDAGKWKAEHFIDLGDSQFGDRWYELISLYLSVFAGDKPRFKKFLSLYKFPSNDPRYSPKIAGKSWLDYYYQDPSSFIKRAMNYTLIHHCDAFTTALRHFPEYRNSTSVDDLASLIWDLDRKQ